MGRPGRAKSGQEPSKSVPRAPQRRSKNFWGHSQDARKRRSHRTTQLEAFADRFLSVFGRRTAAPKCVSYRSCQCFIDIGRFARRTLAARKNLEKTTVEGSKIEARGVLGTLGRASSSAKTAKSSEKVRPKCLRGLRKFICWRERADFERKGSTASGQGRAGARTPRRLFSESSNG